MAAAKKEARSRLWTPGCEAAPALAGTTLVNHDKAVRLRARKPKQAKLRPKKGKGKNGRNVTGTALGWAPQEMMAYLVCFVPLWESAEALRREYAPARVSRPGPKRNYTEFEPLLIVAARTILELSWNKTINMLSDPELWSRMARVVEDTFPNNPDRRLAPAPMTRSQFFGYKRAHWDEDTLEEVKEILVEASLKIVVHMGGFSPDKQIGTLMHPDKSQMATGDGSWCRARHQATPRQREEAAALGITLLCNDDARDFHDEKLPGGSRGYLAAMNIWNPEHRQERLLLSFDYVGEGETDATVCTRMACDMKAKYPHLTEGFLAMTYDMRISAPNADDLLDAGVLPITKLSVKGKGRASVNLGEHIFKLKSGTEEHPHQQLVRLLALDGPPVIQIVDAQGVIHYEPLERKKTFAKTYPNRSTVYVDYVVRDRPIVPAHLVGAEVRVRMNSTNEERKANPHRRRTLALRPISEFDPDFDRVYGLRENSESNFGHAKGILLQDGRVPTETRRGLTLLFLSFQFKLMLTALMAHHRRTGTSLKGWFGDHPPPYRGDPTY